MLKKFIANYRSLIIIACFCIPLFINLGANSLWDGNEGFYAEPPREVVESGNYLIPTYNYQPRLKKPPLATWLIAGSYKLWGVNEWASRLPAAWAAALIIYLTYLIGKQWYQESIGLFAALILATMLKFMIYVRQFSGDILLTFFVTLTLLLLARASTEPVGKSQYLYKLLAYITIGLGILDKGIIAIAIPLTIMGLFMLITRQWGLLKLIVSPTGYIVMMAIGFSWYLLMYQQYGGQFIKVNIIQETVQRYTSDSLGGKPIYYYIQIYLAETLPWSLFTIPALAYWYYWLKRELSQLKQRELKSCLPLLPLVWFGFILIFFSLSIGKRAVYILPLYPAAALMISHYWHKGLEEVYLLKIHRFIAYTLGISTLLAAIFIGVASQQLLAISPSTMVMPMIVLTIMALGLISTTYQNAMPQQGKFLTLVSLIFTLSITLVMPQLEVYRPVRNFAGIIKATTPKTTSVGTFFIDTPSLMFYVERPIFQSWDFTDMVAHLEQEPQVYFITRLDYLEQLQQHTHIPLKIIAKQPLLQLRWGNFGGLGKTPTVQMILVCKA